MQKAQNYSEMPGVTAPISNERPTETEIELSRKLEDSLKAQGIFETDLELTHR